VCGDPGPSFCFVYLRFCPEALGVVPFFSHCLALLRTLALIPPFPLPRSPTPLEPFQAPGLFVGHPHISSEHVLFRLPRPSCRRAILLHGDLDLQFFFCQFPTLYTLPAALRRNPPVGEQANFHRSPRSVCVDSIAPFWDPRPSPLPLSNAELPPSQFFFFCCSLFL